MNILEKANEKSILQNLLRPLSINPFIYNYSLNMSDGVKYSEYVNPRTSQSPTYGSILYFDIPKYGLLSRLIVETTLTSTGDNSLYQDKPGERIFEWIDLQTVAGSRSIQKTTSEYITLRTDQLDESTNSRMNDLLQPSPDLNNSSSIVYTPFYGYYGEHPNKFIDTKRVEDLQLVIKVAPSLEFIGFPQAIDSFSFRLHCTYFTTDTYFPIPKTIVTVQEFDEEPTLIPTGSTSATIFLKANRSVSSTHFLLKDANQNMANILTVKFKVDGKIFYDTTNRLSLLDNGWYSNTNLSIDNTKPSNALGNRFLSAQWGLYRDRNCNTLCIDFSQLGAVEVVLTFDTLPADYYLYIIHEYLDLLHISDSGLIERTYIH